MSDEVVSTGDSPEGWGSHKPALRALARFLPIRSVIEFGAGPHSTHLFLDRERFPLLESLVSFEHDWEWAIKARRADDFRHEIFVLPTWAFVAVSTGMKADFVFVDAAGDRVPLIQHALTLAPILAVHDYQEGQLDGLGFKYVRGFNGTIQTVFASNTIDLSELRPE